MQCTNKLTIQENILKFNTSVNMGLSSKEAAHRLKIYGLNEIQQKIKDSPFKILIRQFTDLMIIILLACTAISFLLGDITEAFTIIAIVIINGVMGFIQEYRSEKSIEALKNMTSPSAIVIRDGKQKNINAADIVPGDVVLLQTGDKVPADGLLIEGARLQSDESILTGESVAVEKKASKVLPANSELHNNPNMVFMGTVITLGMGKMIVTHTGMSTEMGKIADMIQNVEDELTPLQKKLEHLGKFIVFVCIAICVAVFVIGVIRGEDIYSMFLSGVSLAVAAVPEGLPAIVTVALAIGVQNMVKKNALVRKLPAVETLGCASVICSDKTGTLTENKMTVRKLYVGGQYYYVSGSGYDKDGGFFEEFGDYSAGRNKICAASLPQPIKMLLEIAVLCNNSDINKSYLKNNHSVIKLFEKRDYISSVSGDPTEIALLVAALKADIKKEDMQSRYIRIDEIPFDSDRKCMSVICKTKTGESFVFTKGAADVVLEKCSKRHTSNGVAVMTQSSRKRILDSNNIMGNEALRVLGFAFKKLDRQEKYDADDIENNLEFVGLMGMIDPPRDGVVDSIRKCKLAGITPVMITGDHQCTAKAIAKELGILEQHEKVVSFDELDNMDDNELRQKCTDISVYARVSPRHKLRIVRALKDNGHIVAMTGDGVNDAPALKEADIGISMGISGTDVSKEASSMILADDNFSTIVKAIEEGRVIYNNIRKFIRYMLSCNIGEVLTMLIGIAAGLPIPLLPIQILWVNLVTDGLPAIALGFEPAEKDIMMFPPRGSHEGIFSRGLAATIILRGVLIGIGTLTAFVSVMNYTGSIVMARTVSFATLCTMQLIYVFECKSERRSILEIPLFSNEILVWAVICSFAMLIAVLNVPVLQKVFKTATMGINEWAMVIGFSLLGPALMGLWRAVRR